MSWTFNNQKLGQKIMTVHVSTVSLNQCLSTDPQRIEITGARYAVCE